MWQEERQQKIRRRLAAYGQISIDRIVADFGVSRETIRRDLMEMERAGLLRRIRGGAVPTGLLATGEAETFQAPFNVRHTQRRQEKQAIATAALSQLKSGMTLFMDAGSTMTIMAQTLAEPNGLSDMTIITNSIDVARCLVKPYADDSTESNLAPPSRFKVIMLGGEFKQNPMEMTGVMTVNSIHNFQADVALLAPWGINGVKGASNYHLYAAEIAGAMARNANQRILLADYSRIGNQTRFIFCPVDQINIIITNAQARNRPAFDELKAGPVEMIVAEDQ